MNKPSNPYFSFPAFLGRPLWKCALVFNGAEGLMSAMRARLTLKIGVLLCAVVTAVSFLFFVDRLFWRTGFTEHTALTMDRLAKSSEKSLEDMNYARLDPLLQAEMHDKGILGISVQEGVSDKNKVVKAIERQPDGTAQLVAMKSEDTVGDIVSKDIFRDGSKLGSVSVQFSDQVLRSKRRSMLAWEAIQLGSLAALFFFSMALMLRHKPALPLQRDINKMSSRATDLIDSVEVLKKTSLCMADESLMQAGSIEASSASLVKISSATKANAEMALVASAHTGEARAAAEQGATNMQALAEVIGEIKMASYDISKITKTIDLIAFQTKMLSINAAVEAAHAGGEASGFAVVANEVRHLAQRTTDAARETADKIATALHKTQLGVSLSEKVNSNLKDIVEKVSLMHQCVGDVATTSKEQSEEIGQISSVVSQMDLSIQNNSVGLEETLTSVKEINLQASMLGHVVNDIQAFMAGGPLAKPTNEGEEQETPIVVVSSVSVPLGREEPPVFRPVDF